MSRSLLRQASKDLLAPAEALLNTLKIKDRHHNNAQLKKDCIISLDPSHLDLNLKGVKYMYIVEEVKTFI